MSVNMNDIEEQEPPRHPPPPLVAVPAPHPEAAPEAPLLASGKPNGLLARRKQAAEEAGDPLEFLPKSEFLAALTAEASP